MSTRDGREERGFLNTEAALKLAVTSDWEEIPTKFHPGCGGSIRRCPYNPLVEGCLKCQRTEVNRWQPEFWVRQDV